MICAGSSSSAPGPIILRRVGSSIHDRSRLTLSRRSRSCTGRTASGPPDCHATQNLQSLLPPDLTSPDCGLRRTDMSRAKSPCVSMCIRYSEYLPLVERSGVGSNRPRHAASGGPRVLCPTSGEAAAAEPSRGEPGVERFCRFPSAVGTPRTRQFDSRRARIDPSRPWTGHSSSAVFRILR